MDSNGKNTIRKMTGTLLLFLICFTVFAAVFNWKMMVEDNHNFLMENQNTLLALNEIEKLIEQHETSQASVKIDLLMNEIRLTRQTDVNKRYGGILIMYIVCMAFLLVVYFYLYLTILKPFHRLEDYASEIANGNLNISLSYERKNIFGAFTWAFDHMRKEIVKARNCEKEAIENNKTVIATLSHDIKTPIASIRAYTEALEANMDTSSQRRERYIGVILKKCDEVTSLTNDLFLHSLSDMEKLQVINNYEEISEVIHETIGEIMGIREDIRVCGILEEAVLNIDRKRFSQVLENIISNARKYAPLSPIEVTTKKENGIYEIHIRDYGEGIAPEDLPFILDKFYRGKNAGQVEGAGLGLYIVRYIMKQMDGDVVIFNSNGLEVILKIPL